MTAPRDLPALGEEERRILLDRAHHRFHSARVTSGIGFPADEAAALFAEIAALRAERDALIRSTGEHVTVRCEYYARATTAEATVSNQAETIERLRAALLPFAEFCEPIKGEVGRPSPLELSLKDTGGMEEFYVGSHFGKGLGAIYADDFREARAALSDTSPSALAPAQEGAPNA